MPYGIVKVGGGYKVAVVDGPHKGKTFSKKPLTHRQAVAQLAAIKANEGKGR